MPPRAETKQRDADRSREAILAAAERLFAERGYEAASLQDIGAAAGLSRGTPSYFFGSKDQLYAEVLQRAFNVRHDATRAAFEPVFDWCDGTAGVPALRTALAKALQGYMDFLAAHPAFTSLVMREELDDARRMRSLAGTSTAMQDAFAAVRKAGRKRGLRAFKVEDAVFLCIALTFAAFSYENTFMRSIERDLSRPADRRRHLKLAVDQLMYLLAG